MILAGLWSLLRTTSKPRASGDDPVFAATYQEASR